MPPSHSPLNWIFIYSLLTTISTLIEKYTQTGERKEKKNTQTDGMKRANSPKWRHTERKLKEGIITRSREKKTGQEKTLDYLAIHLPSFLDTGNSVKLINLRTGELRGSWEKGEDCWVFSKVSDCVVFPLTREWFSSFTMIPRERRR